MMDITTCNAILAIVRSYEWRRLPPHVLADLAEVAACETLPHGARRAAQYAIDHNQRRVAREGETR